ncbi:MAG: RMD1 family protein, partial [Flavobacteriaceae bacterium]
MYTVIALQIANSLNIRQCKQKPALPILFSDSDELFLANGDEKYIYLFQYGVVAFFNHNTTEINRLIAQLNPEAT